MTEAERQHWLDRLRTILRLRDASKLSELAQELTDSTPQAQALRKRILGLAALMRRETVLANEYADQAIALYREQNDPEGEGSCLNLRGSARIQAGRPRESIADLERAIEVLSEHGTVRQHATALNDLGTAYIKLNDLRNAVAILERAIGIASASGETSILAIASMNLGSALRSMGNVPDAIEQLTRALAYAIDLGLPSLQAGAHYLLGTSYSTIAQFPRAFEHYVQAAELFQASGDEFQQITTKADIGRTYASMGDHVKAIEMYDQVLTYLEVRGVEDAAASTIANKGSALYAIGDVRGAIALLERALEIQERYEDAENANVVRGNIVSISIESGDIDRARVLLDAFEKLHADPTPGLKVTLLTLRSRLLMHDGKFNEAYERLTEALDVATANQLRQEEAEVHRLLRDTSRAVMNIEAYIEHNDLYTTITEELRGREAAVDIAMQVKQREMQAFEQERQRERAILHATLPAHIADRLLRGEDVSGDTHANAAVLFVDIVGFTSHTSDLSASQTTEFLAKIYESFDAICERTGLTKIKTIGDSYMAVAFGLADGTDSNEVSVAIRTAEAALAMSALEFNWPDGSTTQFRIGAHAGPVVAGVIGNQRLQYDVWGDTVNIASRMESTGEPGRIQVSEAFAEGLGAMDDGQEDTTADVSLAPRPYTVALRGETEIKGKGTMTTYWLEGA